MLHRKLVAAKASRLSCLMSDVLEATVLRVQSWTSRKDGTVRHWRPRALPARRPRQQARRHAPGLPIHRPTLQRRLF